MHAEPRPKNHRARHTTNHNTHTSCKVLRHIIRTRNYDGNN